MTAFSLGIIIPFREGYSCLHSGFIELGLCPCGRGKKKDKKSVKKNKKSKKKEGIQLYPGRREAKKFGIFPWRKEGLDALERLQGRDRKSGNGLTAIKPPHEFPDLEQGKSRWTKVEPRRIHDTNSGNMGFAVVSWNV